MSKNMKAVASQNVEVAATPETNMIAPKPSRHRRTLIFQSYLIWAIVTFIVLAVLAKTIAYFTFDVAITREIQEFNVWWFDGIMDVLSWIGFAPQSWIISTVIILFLYLNRLKWETVVTVVSLIGMSLLGLGIKILIQRPRPSADLVNVVLQLSDYSFPSGHVLYATTFYGFLLFLVYTLLKHSWLRTVLLIVLGAMIVLMGFSRIYEGEHWASDVFAAYLLGSVWLSLSIYVYRWGKSRFFVNQSAAQETTS